MTNTLRNTARGLFALILVSAFAVVAAHGQSRDLRVIKAVAGGVNLVSGDVKLQTPGQSGWQRLTMKDDLKSGDIVRSGTDGRAEVLLNPGSYLRLGINSEFELTDASLDKLRVKLYKGSAVIEATGYDDMPLSIAVETPRTELRLLRSGIYRINITSTNDAEVVVQKGRALVSAEPGTLVKSGQMARMVAGSVVVAKFDKQSLDEFDLWSKERAKELAKLNQRLNNRETNTLLANANFNRFGRLGPFGSYGVWLFNAGSGYYTFMPFFGYWASPYGNSYGSYWPAYTGGCYNCGSNGRWNDPFGGTLPSPKMNPPDIYSPSPANNPIPVTRSTGSEGGIAPSSGGKVKP